jgi:triosephosphate isomerase
MAYKTWKKLKTLQDTVTSAEASAGKKIMFVGTGVPATATDPFIFTTSIKRVNIEKSNNSYSEYSTVSGAVVIKTNSTDYVLTAGDVITISGTYV